MKYFLLGLLSLPLITSCTVIEEEYGPYGPPPPRAEVYRYEEPGRYHRHPRVYQYDQGAYPSAQARPISRHPSAGNTVIVRPGNQSRHGQVVAPQNTHGHGQVVAPQNTHGHGQVVAPQNTHGNGQVVVPKKSGTVPAKTVKKPPSASTNQVPSTSVQTHN